MSYQQLLQFKLQVRLTVVYFGQRLGAGQSNSQNFPKFLQDFDGALENSSSKPSSFCLTSFLF